jgi:hypothetical protein
MAIFTGGLENLAGTAITAVSYFIPMLLSNPLASLLLVGGLKHLIPSIQASDLDVGASLGIFGTAGALFWFLRYRKSVMLLLLTLVVADTAGTGVWLTLNHVVAISLGITIGRIALKD